MPKAKKNKPDDKITNMYTSALYGCGIGIYSITAVKGLKCCHYQASVKYTGVFVNFVIAS